MLLLPAPLTRASEVLISLNVYAAPISSLVGWWQLP